jgi:hypothetical protein
MAEHVTAIKGTAAPPFLHKKRISSCRLTLNIYARIARCRW